MKVRDVMQKHVTTIGEDESLALAQQVMLWSGIRHLPVRRKPDGRVVGIISERDVLRSFKSLGAEPEGFGRPVSEFMTSPADHIHPDAEDTILAFRGSGQGFLVDGWHDMNEGDVLYAPQGVRHGTRSPEGGGQEPFVCTGAAAPPQMELYRLAGYL